MTRAAVLAARLRAHPERFILKPPEPPKLPTASWINRPDDSQRRPLSKYRSTVPHSG